MSATPIPGYDQWKTASPYDDDDGAELATIAPEKYDRRRFVGGSDIAGVLGLAPPKWRTAVQIWERKIAADAEPEPETEREKRKVLARGKVVEPLVALMLESLHGITGATRGRRYVDSDVPYFAAEIDLEVPFYAVAHLFPGEAAVDADELVNVEIKTVHPFAADEWGDEGTEDVPIHYAAQVYWGLGVTRRRFALCAALFGADDLVLYPIVAHEPTIAGMRAKAGAFWTDYVLTGNPPPPATIADTARLWPEDDGSELEADDDLEAAIRTLHKIRQARASYEHGEDGVALLIRETVKSASIITRHGVELATLKAQATHSIDAGKLKEQFPEAYRACARKGSTRVLRLKQNAL